MNVQVYYQNTNITSQVVSYTRDKNICNSVGRLDLFVKGDSGINFTTYKPITIYEGGNKKGTFYIHTISRELPGYLIQLSCQDGSMRAQDYFVTDQYFIDYPSYSSYWIGKFLSEAGLSYSINSGDLGTLLSNDTSMGPDSTYNLVMPLLQQNGWYMYFDPDNVAQIGRLSIDSESVSEVITDSTIMGIRTILTDKMLRNRVAVWGSANSFNNDWVFADLSTTTPYNYDSQDVRTIVIANSNIPDNSTAYSIAYEALKEFQQVNYEKEIQVAGYLTVDIGDVVQVKSNYYSGIGLVTSVSVNASSSGFTTSIVLDQRCPRLFSYFDFGSPVYIGTAGSGVWKKHLKFDHTWTNYSDGLQDLFVVDLSVNNGVLACVTSGGSLYTRHTSDSAWTKFVGTGYFTDYRGNQFHPSGLVCNGCAVDKVTNHVLATYSLSGFQTTAGVLWTTASAVGWVMDLNTGTGTYDVNNVIVIYSGEFNLLLEKENPKNIPLDIDNDGKETIISAITYAPVIPSLPFVVNAYRDSYNPMRYTGPFTTATPLPGKDINQLMYDNDRDFEDFYDAEWNWIGRDSWIDFQDYEKFQQFQSHNCLVWESSFIPRYVYTDPENFDNLQPLNWLETQRNDKISSADIGPVTISGTNYIQFTEYNYVTVCNEFRVVDWNSSTRQYDTIKTGLIGPYEFSFLQNQFTIETYTDWPGTDYDTQVTYPTIFLKYDSGKYYTVLAIDGKFKHIEIDPLLKTGTVTELADSDIGRDYRRVRAVPQDITGDYSSEVGDYVYYFSERDDGYGDRETTINHRLDIHMINWKTGDYYKQTITTDLYCCHFSEVISNNSQLLFYMTEFDNSTKKLYLRSITIHEFTVGIGSRSEIMDLSGYSDYWHYHQRIMTRWYVNTLPGRVSLRALALNRLDQKVEFLLEVHAEGCMKKDKEHLTGNATFSDGVYCYNENFIRGDGGYDSDFWYLQTGTFHPNGQIGIKHRYPTTSLYSIKDNGTSNPEPDDITKNKVNSIVFDRNGDADYFFSWSIISNTLYERKVDVDDIATSYSFTIDPSNILLPSIDDDGYIYLREDSYYMRAVDYSTEELKKRFDLPYGGTGTTVAFPFVQSIFRESWSSSYYYRTNRGYYDQMIPTTGGEQGFYSVLKQVSPSGFSLVTSTITPAKLDSNLNGFTSIFGGNAWTNGGQLYFGKGLGSGYYTQYLPYYPAYNVTDAKVFTTMSGTSYNSLIGFVHNNPSGVNTIKVIPLTGFYFDPLTELLTGTYTVQESGLFPATLNHFETSNYVEVPYVFVTTSGNHPRFFQQDGHKQTESGYYIFNEYSDNIPQVEVTQIRLDDRV